MTIKRLREDINELLKKKYPKLQLIASDVGLEENRRFFVFKVLEVEPVKAIVGKIRRLIDCGDE